MPSGQNICNCPTPPGGQAVCSEEQLAICRVVNGVVSTECLDPPAAVLRAGTQALKNWILSKVTNFSRSSADLVGRQEEGWLSSGKFVDPSTNTTVRFSLPKEGLNNAS